MILCKSITSFQQINGLLPTAEDWHAKLFPRGMSYTVYTHSYPWRILGWKVSHTAGEIAHSHEIRIRTLFSRPWHAILRSRHTWRSRLAYFSVSHFLSAVLALGSATYYTKNSIFVTPASAQISSCVQEWILRVISAWFGVHISQISHEYLQTALETHEPFHPG